MRRLYVDDCRNPQWTYGDYGPWEVARNYDQAIEELSKGGVDELSLDHDLGPGKSGYDIICWLETQVEERKLEAPSLMESHSANPVGKENIYRVIDSIRRLVERNREEDEERILDPELGQWIEDEEAGS